MFDRRLLFHFNWALFLTTLIISAIGVMVIFSAVQNDPVLNELYIKQIHWIAYGLIAMLLVIMVDYHFLAEWAYLAYFLIVALLLFVLVFGKVISGAQRWIVIGGLTVQVSELAKAVLIIFLAKFFDDSKTVGPYSIRNLVVPSFLVLIPFLLIAKQPDLGTSMVLLLIFIVMAFLNGIKGRSLAWITFCTVIILPFSWYFLKEYQKKRVLTLINPTIDPLGTGYHTIQSKIAIGSGEFWGKGLFAGTQSRLNFLPERHTDFIFSILAEETGFVGSIVLIGLYVVLLLLCVRVVNNCKDKLGLLIAVGVLTMIFISTIINIGMTLGLFPVVGIPLPLMSYGGSSIVTTFIMIGFLLNIEMRRFK